MTEVIWPLPSMVDAVMPAIEQSLTNHTLLSKRIQELTSPPPGSNTLYSLNAQVYGRMKDIEIILTRLIANRKLLTELAHQDNKLSPKKRIRYGKPPAKPIRWIT